MNRGIKSSDLGSSSRLESKFIAKAKKLSRNCLNTLNRNRCIEMTTADIEMYLHLLCIAVDRYDFYRDHLPGMVFVKFGLKNFSSYEPFILVFKKKRFSAYKYELVSARLKEEYKDGNIPNTNKKD